MGRRGGGPGHLWAAGELVNLSAVGPVVQSGPARGPVKAEIAGSNPVGTAILLACPTPGWRGGRARLKATVSKTVIGATLSWVRIPPSPPAPSQGILQPPLQPGP